MSDRSENSSAASSAPHAPETGASDRLQLHVLSLREAIAGTWGKQWDESACRATLTPEKSRTMATNPALGNLPRGEDEPGQVIATHGKRVVGRIDLIAGDLVIQRGQRTSTQSILWGSNLFVPSADRKSMAGAMVLMKTAGVAPTVGAHGPSQMALPLYEKLRFAAIPLERHVLLHRSRSVARRYLGDGLTSMAASTIGDLALLGLRGLNASRGIGSGVRVRRLPSMPAEFAQAIRNDRPDTSLGTGSADAAGDAIPTQIRGSRSIEWLNWLIESEFGSEDGSAPDRHERALFLVENRRREPLGYLLLKVKFHRRATAREFPDLTLGSLADWCAFDNNPEFQQQFRAIVLPLAIRAASAVSVDALEVCVAPDDPIAQRLRSFGFFRAGVMKTMVRANPTSALSAVPFADPAHWSLRYGDGETVLG